MTNEEKRADDLRRAAARETGQLHVEPWRFVDEDEQARWLRKAAAEKPNGTRNARPRKSSGFTPASDSQRSKVKGQPCIVIREDDPCHGPVQPAHVIDRSLGGDGDELGVVPLCHHHHDAYDNLRTLSIFAQLSPEELEAGFRRLEQAVAADPDAPSPVFAEPLLTLERS